MSLTNEQLNDIEEMNKVGGIVVKGRALQELISMAREAEQLRGENIILRECETHRKELISELSRLRAEAAGNQTGGWISVERKIDKRIATLTEISADGAFPEFCRSCRNEIKGLETTKRFVLDAQMEQAQTAAPVDSNPEPKKGVEHGVNK